jgi:excisionase family DNA binding protein
VNVTLDLSQLEQQVRAFVAQEIERRADELRADKWFSSKQTAAYLDCGVGRIHNLVSEGRLPSHKEGGRLLFLRSELDDWIRSGRAAA